MSKDRAELVARLRGIAIAAIGLEASGGYERGAMRALLAAGLPTCQVNPFKRCHVERLTDGHWPLGCDIAT